MTSELPTLSDGDEYVARFVGGPYDGQTEHRIATSDTWEPEIRQIADQNAVDTEFRYVAGEARPADGKVLVEYTFDPAGSEQFIDPADRYESGI